MGTPSPRCTDCCLANFLHLHPSVQHPCLVEILFNTSSPQLSGPNKGFLWEGEGPFPIYGTTTPM